VQRGPAEGGGKGGWMRRETWEAVNLGGLQSSPSSASGPYPQKSFLSFEAVFSEIL
jgi:hypothetical protein